MLNSQNSIKNRLLLYMFGLVLSVGLILLILYLLITYQALTYHIDESNKNLLLKLEKILAVPLLNENYVMIVDILDAEKASSNLEYIWILNKKDEIIACNDENQILLKIPKKMKKKSLYMEYKMLSGETIAVLTNYDIVYSIGKIILIGTFVSLIFLFAFFYLLVNKLSLKISEPLQSIVKALNDISRGFFDISLPTSSLIEIDDMNSSLFETSIEIKEMTENLENEKNKLEESQRKFKGIFNQTYQLMGLLDTRGTLLEINKTALDMVNCKESEVLGKPFWSGPWWSHSSKLQNKLKKFIKQAASGEFVRFETTHPKGNGEMFFVDFSLKPLRDNFGKIIMLIPEGRDITDKVKTEQQLIQSQKMETVGTLAGGLAHDFNNVLGGITGTLSLLKFKRKNGKEISKEIMDDYLNVIEKSADRAGNMVQQLLALSRKQELTLVPTNINEILNHVIKIANNSFDKRVNIKFSFIEKSALIDADATQIEQVFLNFCVNAEHAMTIMRKESQNWGGSLFISVEKIYVDKFFCDHHSDAMIGNYILISIRDTGVGMSAEIIQKIFNPFFTTKEKGKGTGLGLSMVYNIIKQHNGFIDIYSEVDVGSTFNIYFPESEDLNVEDVVLEDNQLIKGEGLILVVDDEKVMRDMATQVLIIGGYNVISAVDGEEGLEIYREKYKDIKGVVLDMAMPKMSGKEVFIEMKKINPRVRVILASGFRQDERVEEVLDLGVCGFIQKPYTVSSFSKGFKKMEIDYNEN